jgi:hypothetical protein
MKLIPQGNFFQALKKNSKKKLMTIREKNIITADRRKNQHQRNSK